MNCGGLGIAVLNGYICAKKFDMKKLLGFLLCALVVAVCSCSGNDYSKEVKYLDGIYFKEKLLRHDSMPVITIHKAKEIKAYDPTLDPNKRNVTIWYETEQQKLTRAMESGDAFDAFIEAFSDNPNSEATVVEFSFPNNPKHFYNILFKRGGEYYDSYEHIGKYAARIGYEFKKSEILQDIKDNM